MRRARKRRRAIPWGEMLCGDGRERAGGKDDLEMRADGWMGEECWASIGSRAEARKEMQKDGPEKQDKKIKEAEIDYAYDPDAIHEDHLD